MKTISTLCVLVLFYSFLNSQSLQTPKILAYIKNDFLYFTDLNTKVNYQKVLKTGPTSNYISKTSRFVFIVNSGVWGMGTNLQVIPISAFADYMLNQDTVIFRQKTKQIPLSNNGNGFSAAPVNDSLLVVTLAQTSELQLINLSSGFVINTKSLAGYGNPQGCLQLQSGLTAVCMADWGSGQGKSLLIYNPSLNQIFKNSLLRLNVIDLIKLPGNDILTWSWGSWSGPENFGSLHIIDKDSLSEKTKINLPDGIKVNSALTINDSLVYLNGFDQSYTAKYLIFNQRSLTVNNQNSGLFSKNITGKTIDNKYIQPASDKTFLYNQALECTDTLNFDVGNLNCSFLSELSVSCISLNLQNGWNMLSIPTTAENMTVANLFPNALSPAYYFDKVYKNADTLRPGVGYWIKFQDPQNKQICGSIINLNSVLLSAGWNLIAVFEKQIPVTQIITNPYGILQSQFFEYLNGYQSVDILKPGKAYWIKSSQNGELIFNSGK